MPAGTNIKLSNAGVYLLILDRVGLCFVMVTGV